MTETPYRAVLCTCPNRETAENIAMALVNTGQAACANIIPGVQSIYRWQGKVENEGELLMIIKTHQEKIPDLQQTIRDLHPYEVPEIVEMMLNGGSASYLAWLDDNTVGLER